MNRVYYVTIGGITEYPGLRCEIDEINNSKFNFDSWEYEPGGIEFSFLNKYYDRDGNKSTVIPKQYTKDTFSIRIIETYLPYNISFLSVAPGRDPEYYGDIECVIHNDDYALAVSNYGSEAFIQSGRFKLNTARQEVVDGVLKTYLKLDRDGIEFFDKTATLPNKYYINSSEVPILLNSRSSMIDLPVTAYRGGNVIFCGRIEDFQRTSDGRCIVSAIDEYECLDIPIPVPADTGQYFSTDVFYGLRLPGKISMLRGIVGYDRPRVSDIVLYIRHNPLPDFPDEPYGGFESFKDFIDVFLKMSVSFIDFVTVQDDQYGHPVGEYRVFQINFQQSDQLSLGEIDLKKIIDIGSAPQLASNNGLNLMMVKYAGNEINVVNGFSGSIGESDSFDIEIPDGVTADGWTVQSMIAAYYAALGSVYEKIEIKSLTESLLSTFSVGQLFTCNQSNLDWMNSCVQSYDSDPIGGVMFVTSISEDTLSLLHVARNSLNPIPPTLYMRVNLSPSDEAFIVPKNRQNSDSTEYGRNVKDLNQEGGYDLDRLEVADSGYKYFYEGMILDFKNVETNTITARRLISIKYSDESAQEGMFVYYKDTFVLNDTLPSGNYWVTYSTKPSSGYLRNWLYLT